jgi:CheY-like chemotaxis protein/DNA-directed RNA polymerase specialized sigma24 family protein
MSLSNKLAPHLPYLRRFSRALSGSQSSGDAYVVALLESLIADNSLFDDNLNTRTAAYKAFIKVWDAAAYDGNERTETIVENNIGGEARLSAIMPMPRKAFLLTTVEDFEESDAATILGVSTEQLKSCIDEAGRQIANQVATNVLIIEDEPIIAMDIESLVEDLGHDVIGIARTRNEASKIMETRHPGLVLADIQLADGSSGIDAVKDILGQIDVPVIFITAYPERLLTGDKPEPAFLITKPFQSNVVKAMVSQALFFREQATQKTRTAV